MITIFCIPKAFTGQIKTIQTNAIKSWMQLSPKASIILCGNEKGTKEFAKKYSLKHIPNIKRNNYGTPLLDSLFEQVISKKNQYYAFINADIIISSSFLKVFQTVKNEFPSFLIVGKRYNLSIQQELDYKNNWEQELKEKVVLHGSLGGSGWIDYFIFSKNVFNKIPSFAVGRTFWDKWLLWYALHKKIPVVDATTDIFAVHQAHDYNHVPHGERDIWEGNEAKHNLELAGGWTHCSSIDDASYFLTKQTYFKRKHPIIKIIVINLRSLLNVSLISTLALKIRSMRNKFIL